MFVQRSSSAAFAELQTEVSDPASDLGAIGVPFWDYNTYSLKLLFPSERDYTLFQHSKATVSQ
jgi:hypothetical protein